MKKHPVDELEEMMQSFELTARQSCKSLEKFAKLFRASPDPLSLSTLAEGRYIDVSDSFLRLFGYAREEVIGSTSTELGLWMNQEDCDRLRQRLQVEGAVRDLELDCRNRLGEMKTLLVSAEIIEIDGQSCILCAGKDITERSQSEAALKDSTAKLAGILTSAGAVIARFRLFDNRDWVYEYFSPETEAIFGYSPKELQANKTLWISRIHPDDVKNIIPQVFEGIFAERKTKVEFRFQHRDGTWRWISDTIVPRRDNADCWVVTCVEVDITERKLAEAALYQREQEFRALVENAPDIIVRLDRQFRYLYVNPKLEQEVGISPSALIGRTSQELGFPEAVVSPCHALLQQVFETGQERRYEHVLPSPQGLTYWFSRIVPEFASDGLVESVLIVSRDITEIKQAEEAIRAQAQRERALNRVIQAIRNSLDLTAVFSTTVSEIGQLLQVDRAEIMQYLPEQQAWLNVVRYHQNSYLPTILGLEVPDQGDRLADQLERTRVIRLDEASNCESEIDQVLERIFPGAWLLVALSVGPSLWGSLTLLRVRRSSLWQNSEVALARAIADQLAIAIQQSQLYQQVLSLNASLERQVQARTAELQLAFNFEATLKRITDRVRDSLDENKILQIAVRELALALEASCCNAALYDLDLGTSTIRYGYSTLAPPVREHVAQMAAFPEIYEQLLRGLSFQFCSVMPDLVLGYVATLTCPIVDDQGVFGDLRLVSGQHDVFCEQDIRLVQQVANQCAIALRQARLYKAAQAQVEELERLNRLKDDFLNTVSHELRSPMANVKMAIEMLKVTLRQAGVFDAATNKATRYFEILQSECQREVCLIDDLLNLARLDSETESLLLTTINFQAWFLSLVEPFAERARNQQQQLQLDLAADLPPIMTELSYLGRILSELLNNACKYTPPGETISVTARATAASLQVNISNSGVELPASEHARIFDRFYRIPNSDPWKHGGTGLGLALVKKLVERLGATIWVESAVGQTAFVVQLPLAGRSS